MDQKLSKKKVLLCDLLRVGLSVLYTVMTNLNIGLCGLLFSAERNGVALASAKAFKSKNPSFIHVMKSSNVVGAWPNVVNNTHNYMSESQFL